MFFICVLKTRSVILKHAFLVDPKEIVSLMVFMVGITSIEQVGEISLFRWAKDCLNIFSGNKHL